jgi:hypothetical protein
MDDEETKWETKPTEEKVQHKVSIISLIFFICLLKKVLKKYFLIML